MILQSVHRYRKAVGDFYADGSLNDDLEDDF
jgi:hypothetical protein